MLGLQQLSWLRIHLFKNRATFPLIVDGDPRLSDYPGQESWGNFPRERADFINWIFDHDVSGVIFLSGHCGFGEQTMRPPDPNGLDQYPLYDLTISSLAAAPVPKARASAWPNLHRVGAPIFVHHFGLVRVGGPPGNRYLVF